MNKAIKDIINEKLNDPYSLIKNKASAEDIVSSMYDLLYESIPQGEYVADKEAAIRATLLKAVNMRVDADERNSSINKYRRKDSENPKPSFDHMEPEQMIGNDAPFIQSPTLHPNRSLPAEVLPNLRKIQDLMEAASKGWLFDKETGLTIALDSEEHAVKKGLENKDQALLNADTYYEGEDAKNLINNMLADELAEMYKKFAVRKKQDQSAHGYDKKTRKMNAEDELKYAIELAKENPDALKRAAISMDKVYKDKTGNSIVDDEEIFQNSFKNIIRVYSWAYDQDGKRENKYSDANKFRKETEYLQVTSYVKDNIAYALEVMAAKENGKADKDLGYDKEFLDMAAKNLAYLDEDQRGRLIKEITDKMEDIEEKAKKENQRIEGFPMYKKLKDIRSQVNKLNIQISQSHEYGADEITAYTNAKEFYDDVAKIREKIASDGNRDIFDYVIDNEGSKTSLIGPDMLWIEARNFQNALAQMQNRQTSDFYRPVYDYTQALLIELSKNSDIGLEINMDTSVEDMLEKIHGEEYKDGLEGYLEQIKKVNDVFRDLIIRIDEKTLSNDQKDILKNANNTLRIKYLEDVIRNLESIVGPNENQIEVTKNLSDLYAEINTNDDYKIRKELLDKANNIVKENNLGELKELKGITERGSDFFHVLSSVKFAADYPRNVTEMIVSHAFEGEQGPEDMLKVEFLKRIITDWSQKEAGYKILGTNKVFGLIEGFTATVGKTGEEFDLNAPVPFIEAYKKSFDNPYYRESIIASSKESDAWKKYDKESKKWVPKTKADALEALGLPRDLFEEEEGISGDDLLEGSQVVFLAGSDIAREQGGEGGPLKTYVGLEGKIELIKLGFFPEEFRGQGGSLFRDQPTHAKRKTDQGDFLVHQNAENLAGRIEEDLAYGVQKSKSLTAQQEEERIKIIKKVLGNDAVEEAKSVGRFANYSKNKNVDISGVDEISDKEFIKIISNDPRVRSNTGNIFKMPNLRVDNVLDNAVRNSIERTNYPAQTYYMNAIEYDGKAGKFAEYKNDFYKEASGIHLYKQMNVANRPGQKVMAGGKDDSAIEKIQSYAKDISLMKTRAIGTGNAAFISGKNDASEGYDSLVAKLGLRDPDTYALKDYDPTKRPENLNKLLLHTYMEPEEQDRLMDINFSIASANPKTAWKFADSTLNNDGTITAKINGKEKTYNIEDLANMLYQTPAAKELEGEEIPKYLIWGAHEHMEFKIATMATYEMNMNLSGREINEQQRENLWNLLDSDIDKAIEKFSESIPRQMRSMIKTSMDGVDGDQGVRWAQNKLAEYHNEFKAIDKEIEAIYTELAANDNNIDTKGRITFPNIEGEHTENILLSTKRTREHLEELQDMIDKMEEDMHLAYHVVLQHNEVASVALRNPELAMSREQIGEVGDGSVANSRF